MEFKNVKVETFMPQEYFNELLEKLNSIGALTIENYDSCVSTSVVMGHWRALEGANPFEGKVGVLCEEEELKVEFKSKYELMDKIIEIIKEVHPYEVPVINVYGLLR